MSELCGWLVDFLTIPKLNERIKLKKYSVLKREVNAKSINTVHYMTFLNGP